MEPPATPRRPILPPHGAGARGTGAASDHPSPSLEVQFDERPALLTQPQGERRPRRVERPERRGGALLDGPAEVARPAAGVDGDQPAQVVDAEVAVPGPQQRPHPPPVPPARP